MCPESVALTILGPLTSPQGFLMPLAADDGSVGREGFAPAFSPSCCRAWGSWNRLSSELEVSVVQNLLQSRIIYWTESEIKILKEDLMSCAWVKSIQLVPGSLLTMTTTLGGPVLGQKTNSDSSFFLTSTFLHLVAADRHLNCRIQRDAVLQIRSDSEFTEIF